MLSQLLLLTLVGYVRPQLQKRGSSNLTHEPIPTMTIPTGWGPGTFSLSIPNLALIETDAPLSSPATLVEIAHDNPHHAAPSRKPIMSGCIVQSRTPDFREAPTPFYGSGNVPQWCRTGWQKVGAISVSHDPNSPPAEKPAGVCYGASMIATLSP
ncbi:hypothetical protein EDC04DRAFT_2630342 [Pisolithus marmoratus]|nr:hypothetical protein EDC04DRAFT_2630342 [Pisolithus marmoratus]